MSGERRSSSIASPSTGVTSRDGSQHAPSAGAHRTAAARARLVGALLGPLHDRLPLYVLAAAVLGVVFDRAAERIDGLVPVFLAGQVTGVALTLPAAQLLRVVRSPRSVVAAMAVQWTVVPLLGIGISHSTSDATVGNGVVIAAVAPAEITSALMALLAGGGPAVALSSVAASLALGTVLTPVWLGVGLGSAAHVDRTGLISQLAVSVALPLVVCVALRTRFHGLARHGARSLDLAALAVVLVVFVSAGRIRPLLGSAALGVAVGLCLLLLAAQLGAGWLCGVGLRLSPAERSAILFPIGMREFGVAAAVAFATAPASAAIAGVYGVVLMIVSPVVARLLRPPGHVLLGGPPVSGNSAGPLLD